MNSCSTQTNSLAEAEAPPLDDITVEQPLAVAPQVPDIMAKPVATHRASLHDVAVHVVSILTILLATRYTLWRCEINNWHAWWLSVPLLAAEIFTALHILGYQYTIWPRKEPERSETNMFDTPPVFVFIPTVNEGDDVLGLTIRGALETRRRFLEIHPNACVRIIVCNDGYVAGSPGWQSTVALAERCGVECVTRKVGGGAKAGNIENARRQTGATGDSLIVVLDADQIAHPDFLLRTIAPFSDPTVGWVQTRQYYRNQDSRIARWAEYQASLFYDFVCPGKAAVNSSFICGTNVVVRASVLDRIGGFPQESITEDFAASIRTHHEWRSVYIKDVLAEGLGPMDLTAYLVQQSRWARGTIGVLLSDWRRIASPAIDGLAMRQRIQYMLSGTHYLCGVRDLIFLSCAVLCLITNHSPVKTVSLIAIAGYLLPYIFATQLLLCLQAGWRPLIRSMVLGYASFPILVVSLIEAITNRRVPFIVTPKSASKRSDLRAVMPHIILTAICVASLAYSAAAHVAWTPVKCIPFFWVAYALLMLLPTFALAKLAPARAE
ncbi:MAG: glycosyltransferase [Capsulimonadaceae bacterium]|nr:glycosyltransferase [Capsulimonadaceae bacterium]